MRVANKVEASDETCLSREDPLHGIVDSPFDEDVHEHQLTCNHNKLRKRRFDLRRAGSSEFVGSLPFSTDDDRRSRPSEQDHQWRGGHVEGHRRLVPEVVARRWKPRYVRTLQVCFRKIPVS